MLRLSCWSSTRTEDVERMCVWLHERAHACVSSSVCPVQSDWFWSMGSWQSIRLSQEAQDHGAETDERPSLSPQPFPHFNLTPFPPCYFYPPLWWVYWYVTWYLLPAKMSHRLAGGGWEFLMRVNKRQTCLVIYFEGIHSCCSLYLWDIADVEPSIGRKKTRGDVKWKGLKEHHRFSILLK